jgi:hypothetical protein
MPNTLLIHRIHDEASAIAKQNAYMREVIAECLKILALPVPDTFLGRQTHEPPENELS